MTKLRRLDPQPADLTTHKGPFVHRNGYSARIIATDRVDLAGKNLIWAIMLHQHGCEQTVYTDKTGSSGRTAYIFAAEEIREPMVQFVVFKNDGDFYHIDDNEREARCKAAVCGGVVYRMVQDTSYGGSV